jgi:hypothetical protein
MPGQPVGIEVAQRPDALSGDRSMQIYALDHSDRTAVLMFATAVSMYGDATPPCDRAANDCSADHRDPPPRPATSAPLPPRYETLRLAA